MGEFCTILRRLTTKGYSERMERNWIQMEETKAFSSIINGLLAFAQPSTAADPCILEGFGSFFK